MAAERDEGLGGILASIGSDIAEHYGIAGAGKSSFTLILGKCAELPAEPPAFTGPVF